MRSGISIKERRMYKAFTAQDLKKSYGFLRNYRVAGFLVYGTYQDSPYPIVEAYLTSLDIDIKIRQLPHRFFRDVVEITVDDKVYWFVAAYGGTLLSEWLHVACLFGSKINIALGKCGGLFKDAVSGDLIIPTYSFADESPTRAYEPEANKKHHADNVLRQKLIARLEGNHRIWEGPTITHQAMLAETFEDIQNWSDKGYYGVEMESATVFAVSNYFNVPSAAVLMISDNLIKEETVLDADFKNTHQRRSRVSQDMIKAALNELLGIEYHST